MNRDEVLAGDEQVHLAQGLGILGAVAPRAVEDEKDVIVVDVELRALPEMLAVLHRERVEAEDLMQLSEFLGSWRAQIEPKEVIAPKVVTDALFVNPGEARHHELKLAPGSRCGSCSRLADRHSHLLGRCWQDAVPAGPPGPIL